MRVAVNLCWLVPGVVGGSEESTVRSLRAVADLVARGGCDGPELSLFGLDALRRAHPDLAERFPLRTVPLSGRLKPVRVAAEHTWLAGQLRRFDVVHHAGGTAPGHGGPPVVLTVHDIQPLDLPGNFHPVKVAWLRRALPRAVRRAAVVVVPSEFVRGRLVERLGADPQRVVVVPHPAPPPVAVGAEQVAAARARLGLPQRYLLLGAITYPHKRHVVALRALAELSGPDAPGLVLTGGEGPAEPAVRAEVDRLGLGDRVVRTGRIPESELQAVLQGAEAVVFPSVYEGFGQPALEAMAAGVPLVVAGAGALPEVVGAGLTGAVVPPDDPRALAAALRRLLEDGSHRATAVAAGRARAASFSPEATARGLVAVYRLAVAAR